MATSNSKLNEKYLNKVKSLNKDKHIEDIYLDLLHGKNSYMRYTRLESSYFDPSWINVIEDVLFDLGEIVSNPRTVTKSESNIVPIELAKKTDGESVQHLASHTQYIKEIKEDGNVVPSKILSHSTEDNLYTYENRFIATFIRRLVLFVEKRYDFIHQLIPLHIEDSFYIKNRSIVNGEEVEIETKIKVKKESVDDYSLEAKGYVERIEKMREYIYYYYNSPFMKKMKNERDVRKPILQTNIIRKNPKYNKCYKAFLFIEKFQSLGVNYHVNSNYQAFNEQDLADMNYLLLSSYLAMKGDREYESVKKSDKIYKPKVLTGLDDELFTYGEPLTGTLEFVRVDEDYRNYLNKLREVHDLPLHPNKYERLYYKDEYLYKKVYQEQFKEVEKLLRRKVREHENYEKEIQKILAYVAIEDRKAEEERMRQVVADELAKLENKRQEIIQAALKEHKDKETCDLKDRPKTKNNKEINLPKVEEVVTEEKKTAIEEIKLQAEQFITDINTKKEELKSKIDEIKEEQHIKIEKAEEVISQKVEEVKSKRKRNNKKKDIALSIDENGVDATAVISSIDEVMIEEKPVPEELPPIDIEPLKENIPEEDKKEMLEEVKAALEDEAQPLVEEDIREENMENPVEEVPTEENIVEEKPAEEPLPVKEEIKPIPGRFIVKTLSGYYIDEDNFSENKHQAFIFDDYNRAKDIKNRLGGKIVKL